MTNHERADRLLSDARDIAAEMHRALDRTAWNLAVRRAQEVVELVGKALLSEMGVDTPKTHDPGRMLAEVLRERGLVTDETRLAWLTALSAHLSALRGPAFYQGIIVNEADARAAVEGADRVLAFGEDLAVRLRSR